MLILLGKNVGRAVAEGHHEQLHQKQHHYALQCWVHHQDAHPFPQYRFIHSAFVVKLSARSNDICERNNKKTISAEHLEAALVVRNYPFRSSDSASTSKISRISAATSRSRTKWRRRPTSDWRRWSRRTCGRKKRVGWISSPKRRQLPSGKRLLILKQSMLTMVQRTSTMNNLPTMRKMKIDRILLLLKPTFLIYNPG